MNSSFDFTTSRPDWLSVPERNAQLLIIRLAIISHSKEFDRRKAFRQYVLADLPAHKFEVEVHYRFIMGYTRDVDDLRVAQERAVHSDILVIDQEDGTDRMGEKRRRMLRWAAEMPGSRYDYYMSADTDAFVRLAALARRLRKYKSDTELPGSPREQDIMWGRMGAHALHLTPNADESHPEVEDEEVPPGPARFWYSYLYGFIYLFNSHLVDRLTRQEVVLPHHIHCPADDVILGMWVANHAEGTTVVDDVQGFHDPTGHHSDEKSTRPVSRDSVVAHHISVADPEMIGMRKVEEFKDKWVVVAKSSTFYYIPKTIISRPKEFDRRKAFRQYVLADLPAHEVEVEVHYRFIVGYTRDVDDLRVAQERAVHSDILVIDQEDGTDRMGEKRRRMLRWAAEMPGSRYDYYMSADTDAFVRLAALARRLRKYKSDTELPGSPREQDIMWGRMGAHALHLTPNADESHPEVEDEEVSPGPAGFWYSYLYGFSYLFSSHLVDRLTRQEVVLPHHIDYPADDVILGVWVADHAEGRTVVDDVQGFHDPTGHHSDEKSTRLVSWDSVVAHHISVADPEMMGMRKVEEFKDEWVVVAKSSTFYYIPKSTRSDCDTPISAIGRLMHRVFDREFRLPPSIPLHHIRQTYRTIRGIVASLQNSWRSWMTSRCIWRSLRKCCIGFSRSMIPVGRCRLLTEV
ncbi:hypothetical protein BDV98DRAFT_595402 [Pterulicium gracile]|uniref:Glycosyltransferase family 31 protein n=1 Tax=Pterulicium gracile TaxID=1884261 RepID=A0A5C3Q9I3_9AGAR|nr:hypothetical protein BDV98DRAFT_595402 [Pterula gracilis]